LSVYYFQIAWPAVENCFFKSRDHGPATECAQVASTIFRSVCPEFCSKLGKTPALRDKSQNRVCLCLSFVHSAFNCRIDQDMACLHRVRTILNVKHFHHLILAVREYRSNERSC